MSNLATLLISGMAAAFLVACSSQDNESKSAQLDTLQARVEQLEQMIQTTRETATQLQIDVANLEQRVAQKSAAFDPADSAFQRIDSVDGYGTFAVSVQDVRPFGDGVQVTLHLGNPWNVDYDDAKLTVKYGPRVPDLSAPKPAEAISEWKKSLKTKEHTVTQRLSGGSWNPVKVTLPNIKAEQFGFLEVSIETERIYLTR